MAESLSDTELARRWEAGRAGCPITHLEHVRIVRTLLIRKGLEATRRRVHEATRRNCEALGVPERYDRALTDRWVAAIASANEADAEAPFDEFLRRHPGLQRGHLFGVAASEHAS